jgi:hypothetical protein
VPAAHSSLVADPSLASFQWYRLFNLEGVTGLTLPRLFGTILLDEVWEVGCNDARSPRL